MTSTRPNPRRAALALALTALVLTAPGLAIAQQALPTLTAAPDAELQISEDTTPLGVVLRALVVVDISAGPNAAAPKAGVDLTHAGDLLQSPALRARLAAFVGTELSPRVISLIRAEIVREFRTLDRPLVSVTLPPQEITGGALRLDVLPYRVGAVAIEGNQWTPDAHLDAILRLEPGAEISGEHLLADLNRMNVNPYRNATATFSPGAAPGTTDVTITAAELRPWSLSAGAEHFGGSVPLVENRLTFGLRAANIPALDNVVSLDAAISPGALAAGRLLELGDTHGYLSHAASLALPLDWSDEARHGLRLGASRVQQFDALTDTIDQATLTTQFTADYTFGLLGFPGATPQLHAGFELKQQLRDVLFGGTVVDDSAFGVGQVVLGVRGDLTTSFGTVPLQASYDATLYASPGNLFDGNTDAAFVDASGEAAASATYYYLRGQYRQRLGLAGGLVLDGTLVAQLSPDILPATEKLTLGGPDSVRGYAVSEASGDWGAYAQLELRLPGALSAGEMRLEPYVFLDAGYAASIATGTDTTLAAAGAGLDLDLGQSLDASIVVAAPLLDGPSTQAGALRLYTNLKGSY